jgi:hypothetical protein
MDIIKYIEQNIPFVFAKFGDGEYYASIKANGGNCDGTPYTQKLGDGIIESFKYLTDLPNVYIGKWLDFKGVADYFQSLTTNTVNWENYNIFISRSRDEFLNRALPYFKAIRNAKQEKIYICNETMVNRSKEILNIDRHVVIHPVNWFEADYENILQSAIKTVQQPDNVIIMTSAGMGAKILIADLRRYFPNAIILDIGSAIDFLCSHRRSRDYHNALTYEDTEIIKNAIIKQVT